MHAIPGLNIGVEVANAPLVLKPAVPVPAAAVMTHGRAAREGDAEGVEVDEGDCVAVCRAKRRTTKFPESAMIHPPIPSAAIDGLFKSADVARPPSPSVPVRPGVPATVLRMPAADT